MSQSSRIYALAILDSGNYALQLLRILEGMGYFFEFMSIPCPIARMGCGYCMKLPIEHLGMVIQLGAEHKLFIRTAYKIIPAYLKNRYELIYESPPLKKR